MHARRVDGPCVAGQKVEHGVRIGFQAVIIGRARGALRPVPVDGDRVVGVKGHNPVAQVAGLFLAYLALREAEPVGSDPGQQPAHEEALQTDEDDQRKDHCDKGASGKNFPGVAKGARQVGQSLGDDFEVGIGAQKDQGHQVVVPHRHPAGLLGVRVHRPGRFRGRGACPDGPGPHLFIQDGEE